MDCLSTPYTEVCYVMDDDRLLRWLARWLACGAGVIE